MLVEWIGKFYTFYTKVEGPGSGQIKCQILIEMAAPAIKDKCPLCDYKAPGTNRSDALRRHTKTRHAEWQKEITASNGQVMPNGFIMQLQPAKPTSCMMLREVAGGRVCTASYCFCCFSYIETKQTGMSKANADTTYHTCKAPRIKSAAPASASAKPAEAPAPKVKSSTSVFDSLKANPRLNHLRLADKEQEAYKDSMEIDPDEVFDPIMSVLVPILTSCGKEETRITNMQRMVHDLKAEKAAWEEEKEEMKIQAINAVEEQKQKTFNVLDDLKRKSDGMEHFRSQCGVLEKQNLAMQEEIDRLRFKLAKLQPTASEPVVQ